MEVTGIDISKTTFDAYNESHGHHKFSNNTAGFQQLIDVFGSGHYIMESTCSYHISLALFLFESSHHVSVVNPLPVKRFIQMRMQKLKTDKSDAKMLCLYGKYEAPKAWTPEPEFIQEAKMALSLIELYLRQQTALKNKLDNLVSGGTTKGKLIRSIHRQLKKLNQEISGLNDQIHSSIRANAPKQLAQISSIPGIGKKTAILLLVHSNLFRDFEDYRQFIAYCGLCPVHRSSGTSVQGRSYISKKGNKHLRNHLFLCSFTASVHNRQCKALYQRLVNKGKSKKLALIAVSNKLIKQAFGVVKNDLVYDTNYVSMQP